jgi:hypothetical protein
MAPVLSETKRSWIAVGDTTITVGERDGAIVLSVRGSLDADGGRLVREVAEAAVISRDDDRPVELDLRTVSPLTVEGLRVLAECAALGPGVRFRLANGVSTPAPR